MDALGVPYLAAVGLMAGAGIAKLIRPGSAVPALRALRLPASFWMARVSATLELACASYALLAAEAHAAAIVCASYLAFAAAVTTLLLRGHREVSCGCFGAHASPVSWVHAVVNVGLAGICLGAAFSGPATLSALGALSGPELAGVLLAVPALAYGFYLLVTDLPVVLRLARDSVDRPSEEGRFEPRRHRRNRSATSPTLVTEVHA